MLLTDDLHLGSHSAEILAGHFGEEMMLNVIVEPPVVPILPPGTVNVHVGEDLELVPRVDMEVIAVEEAAAVVAENELEVEYSLHTSCDSVENTSLAPCRQLAQEWNHPAPVKNDGNPLIPTSL